MAKLSRRPARRSSDKTPRIRAVIDSASADRTGLDSASVGVEVFETLDTGIDTVPVASVSTSAPDDAAAVPAALDQPVRTPYDAPPMTRRELREREARAASRRAPDRAQPSAARSTLQAEQPSKPHPTPSAAPVDVPVSRRQSRAGSRASARTRRIETSRRARSRAPRSSSERLVRSTHPAGRPRVAADVVPAPQMRIAKRRSIKRQLFKQFVSLSAMAGVGLILVATTVPADAFSRPEAIEESSGVVETAEPQSVQELKVDSVAAPTVTRDSYTAISQRQQVAARYGDRLMLYTNNPNGTIQWPFPTGVPITSGFGGRQVAGCGFCSTNHLGMDFTPGAGTPIQVIADGTVSKVEVSNGGLGNHVTIDHVINGQKVQTLYAHMQFGSIKVAVGQQVAVGDIVGNVGSTGASTGAHLHFEVHLDGTPVDPFAWLEANAN